MSTWWMAPLVVGPSLAMWAPIGLLRMADEAGRRSSGVHRQRTERAPRVPLGEVAVLMAAHDEESVIEASLARLTALVPASQVHVVSDASTDRTVTIAHRCGVHVVETPENVGKARALTYGLQHFELARRFAAVLVLDADTALDEDYFAHALPLLDDPDVVAVAGCARTHWQDGLGPVGTVLVGHRERIYVLTQLALKFGQTWRSLSVTHIVPGFASIYRASVLPRLTIDAPGLVIEDFNMTFEVHAKHLGKIAFTPGARAYTQDPSTCRDYVGQTSRWSLGLWQTVRRHPLRPGWFALSLAVTLLELVVSSVFFLALPFLVLALVLVDVVTSAAGVPVLGPVTHAVGWPELLLLVVLPDYAMTCLVAAWARRPVLLVVGLLFLPLRVLDAGVALRALVRALSRSTSSGRWTSPSRRPSVHVAEEVG